MTTSTRFKLVCECGHSGNLKMSENDQPYSKCWEKYVVEDLNSKQDHIYVDGSISVQEAVQRLDISCPKCGRPITDKNFAH